MISGSSISHNKEDYKLISQNAIGLCNKTGSVVSRAINSLLDEIRLRDELLDGCKKCPNNIDLPLYISHYSIEDENSNLLNDLGFKPGYVIHLTENLVVYNPQTGMPAKDNNGWIILTDFDTFVNELRNRIPEDYTGPVWFDVEGQLENDAKNGNPIAIERMASMLWRARVARPKISGLGFYGIPWTKIYTSDLNDALNPDLLRSELIPMVTHPLSKMVDILSPSFYERCYGQSWTDAWTDTVIQVNMEVIKEYAYGRPIIPYYWKRYHDRGDWKGGLGETLLNPNRFVSTVKLIKENGADSLILWSDEQSFVRYARMFENALLPMDHPYYKSHHRCKSILDSEKLPHMTDQEYIVLTNASYIQMAYNAWKGNSEILDVPANLGPVTTVLRDYGDFAYDQEEYIKGVSGDISFNTGSDFPSDGYVIFQSWSEVSNQIEGIHNDVSTPFVYTSTSLDNVTTGYASIQAIVRNKNHQNLGIITKRILFKENPNPNPNPNPDPKPDSDQLPDIGDTNVSPNNAGVYKLNSGGPYIISNERIDAPMGVLIDNDKEVDALTMYRCSIRSSDYGVYSGHCKNAELIETNIVTGPGGDSYCLRGVFRTLLVNNCTFDNRQGSKVCFRPYSCFGANIKNSKFLGGPLWLGGGGANSNVDFLPCENMIFENIEAEHTQNGVDWICFYPGSKNIIFKNVKVRLSYRFATIWDGVTDITFEDVMVSFDGVKWEPLNWSHFKEGNILSSQASSRRLIIKHNRG